MHDEQIVCRLLRIRRRVAAGAARSSNRLRSRSSGSNSLCKDPQYDRVLQSTLGSNSHPVKANENDTLHYSANYFVLYKALK